MHKAFDAEEWPAGSPDSSHIAITAIAAPLPTSGIRSILYYVSASSRIVTRRFAVSAQIWLVDERGVLGEVADEAVAKVAPKRRLARGVRRHPVFLAAS